MNGSLHEKHGKYYAVFSTKTIDGKRKTEWVNTGVPAVRGNKRQAQQRLNEIIAERKEKQKSRMASKDILFVDYIDLWLEDVKDTIDTVTYEGYKSYTINHIRPYFEKFNLSLYDVNVNDIENYFKCKSTGGRLDGKEGGLSHASLDRHKAVLSRMFGDAMREPYNLQTNPCRIAKIPKTVVNEDKKISFYTAEQCKNLLDITYGTPLHDMIYLTFIYGFRRSELMGLKWDAVDFDSGIISIKHTVVVHTTIIRKDNTKNKCSNRTYPIFDDTLSILKKLKAKQAEYKDLFGNCYIDSGYVFARENGEPYHPGYPTMMLRRVIERNNLAFIRWHDLRHSCASFLIDKGWPMKDISDWLGHADIGTTMNIYGHLDMAHKRKMAEGLNGTFN